MIRRFGCGDERLLLELCRRFKSRVPSLEEARRFLARRDVATFAALDGQEIVAFAYAYVLPRIDGESSVFLYELAVAEGHRRRGLGRGLVEEVKALARAVDARTAWVQTDADNEAAIRTYEAAGGSIVAPRDVVFRWVLRD